MEKNKQKRKEIPLYSGLVKYFPDALCEVARVSYIGSKQHHPDEDLHWDREKSRDDLDALMRHLMENGMHDIDGARHSAKIAWRALAHLQKEIEEDKVRDEQWELEQYNRNRLPHDQIISGTE
tara:strand:+ start:143 stop:511 length:369 start_codon:yes stop_codon:yes gene_type:complete